ncbi:hypothetical protein CR513_28160, partial [Mucuna pruriens]
MSPLPPNMHYTPPQASMSSLIMYSISSTDFTSSSHSNVTFHHKNLLLVLSITKITLLVLSITKITRSGSKFTRDNNEPDLMTSIMGYDYYV